MEKTKTEYQIEELEKLSQAELNRELLKRVFLLEKKCANLKARIEWDEDILHTHNVPGFREYEDEPSH